MIMFVQGRYFLPLVLLTIVVFSTRPTVTVGGRVLRVFPIVSAAMLLWWTVWAAHRLWGWW